MLKSEALGIINEKISECVLCDELSTYRKSNNYKTVPGVGSPNAKILVLGEAPGENEAKEGEPFIGKAGRLLTNILAQAGLARETVFITNILKCRPPNNRDPRPDEALNCQKFLNMQISCINPEWILCFGRIASINLLKLEQDTKIGTLRHKIHEYEGRKVICTYHPSYALRKPEAKAEIWQDLQPVIEFLQKT